jgi:hypothetical protein
LKPGDRALETARNERATFEEWLGQETCEVHCDESANKNAWYGWQARAALIQSAMNAQERELREALRKLVATCKIATLFNIAPLDLDNPDATFEDDFSKLVLEAESLLEKKQ